MDVGLIAIRWWSAHHPPSFCPCVERGAGIVASSMEQKTEKGKKQTTHLILIYIDPCGRYRALCPLYSTSTASGTSQHTHGLFCCPWVPCLFPQSSVPSRCLSCSPIVGYFLFGAVGMYGERRMFFLTSGPNCLHIVNSTSPSPIKLWLCDQLQRWEL